MYTCKKATELIEKEQSEALSLMTRMRLKMHLMMCGACAAYRKQSKNLSIWLKNKKGASVDKIELSEESKQQMIKKIEKKRSEL
ncbi:zf-HC2 domain-containing protein [Aureispira anguillae]|uniref:Zf-HC2 domain-containing protein n=1 Tax=Aureispira anguillae TaxID=2864201 RepID=A0A915YBD5_9BACT|nr:zf-HC2 domain-containing protein [Aureispira anguillae]BDS09967.1 zf-HC2 domain-containing protein [Aureispira anguillae]